MKKLIIAIAVIGLVSSCIEDNPIQTYSGSQSIYFSNPLADITSVMPGSEGDSASVTFAYTPNKSDSLIKIPVAATGRMASQSRKYEVQLAGSATAEEGIHFDYFEEDFTIPGGSLRDSLQIMLHKTEGLDSDTVLVALELQANENFETGIAEENDYSLVSLNLYATNVISKPQYWFDFYLGSFTPKKFYLMEEVLGIELIRWTLDTSHPNGIGIGEMNYFGTAMQRYLNKQAQNGNTVYNEDGTPMVMGLGVQ